MVARLVCFGQCGDGLEGDLFTCGECGGQTAQGVDGPLALSPVALCERYERFGGRQALTCIFSHHLWNGAWVWTV